MKRPWIAFAAVIAAGAAILVIGVARAAETEGRSPPTHRVVVCLPNGVCEERGRTIGETACQLDAASVRLVADLPKGTRIECRRVRR